MGNATTGRGRVLVVGAGALGCSAAIGLASGGAEGVGVADPDRVEPSNLHRQLLHLPGDFGRNKARGIAERLAAAGCPATAHEERVGVGNAAELFSAYDVVIDATDSPASKFLLNDAAILFDRPLVHAGVVGLEGQLLTVLPRRSACLRCLFPEPPDEGDVPSCREAGILGPVAGVLGLLQAEEALRAVRGEPPRFADRLLTVDARRGRFRTVALSRSPHCPACGPRATLRALELPRSGVWEENP